MRDGDCELRTKYTFIEYKIMRERISKKKIRNKMKQNLTFYTPHRIPITHTQQRRFRDYRTCTRYLYNYTSTVL